MPRPQTHPATRAVPCFRRPSPGPRLRAWLAVAALALGPATTGAETASEAQLKAAYLVNFFKYIDWPTAGSYATICLVGQDTLGRHLAAYAGKTVVGREIRIRRLAPGDPVADCQELFVAEGSDDHGGTLLKGAVRQAVLTVGEAPAFVQEGGAISLLRSENRLFFDINLGVVHQAGLRINPQMLRLAREVVGGPR